MAAVPVAARIDEAVKQAGILRRAVLDQQLQQHDLYGNQRYQDAHSGRRGGGGGGGRQTAVGSPVLGIDCSNADSAAEGSPTVSRRATVSRPAQPPWYPSHEATAQWTTATRLLKSAHFARSETHLCASSVVNKTWNCAWNSRRRLASRPLLDLQFRRHFWPKVVRHRRSWRCPRQRSRAGSMAATTAAAAAIAWRTPRWPVHRRGCPRAASKCCWVRSAASRRRTGGCGASTMQ